MARTLSDQLDLLLEVLGSNRKAAELLNVSHSQIGAWQRGSTTPSGRSLVRIADAVAVLDALRGLDLGRAEIRAELYSLWPELGERPAALVAAGERQRILDAIPGRFANRVPTQLGASPADLAAALRALAAAAVASADALSRAAS